MDAEERALLGGAMSMYASQNVGNDGNYSIQVISKAISNFREDIACTPIHSTSVAKRPYTEEEGFFAHKGNHWIGIRKVNNVWYNLNSTNIVPPGPQFISDF